LRRAQQGLFYRGRVELELQQRAQTFELVPPIFLRACEVEASLEHRPRLGKSAVVHRQVSARLFDGDGFDARADRKRSRLAVHRLGIVEIALEHGEAAGRIAELNGAIGRRGVANGAERSKRARVRGAEVAAVELQNGQGMEARSRLDGKPGLD